MKNIFKKIKQNHWLMMTICCGTPLILLIIAVYFFGLNNKYLFWSILLLCPILHYFLMKDMHKGHSSEEDKEIAESSKNGENKKCH
jgi:hypothetical protein